MRRTLDLSPRPGSWDAVTRSVPSHLDKTIGSVAAGAARATVRDSVIDDVLVEKDRS